MSHRPVVPEGHHLGISHSIDGAVTGHIFEDGSNKLVGHASWVEVDDGDVGYRYEADPQPRRLTKEEIEFAELMAAIIVAGLIKAAEYAAPKVSRWWTEKAAPAMKATWARLSTRSAGDMAVGSEATPSIEPAVFVASATGIEVAVAESAITMSREEWQQRFRAMLLSEAFSDEQRRILASARIEGDDQAVAAQSTAVELTAQQFTDLLASRLQANPYLLTERAATELMMLTAEVRPALAAVR
jgi:hypothetical protein